MTKKTFLLYLTLSFTLYLCSFISFSQQENHPPVVKIISPNDNSYFEKDAPVSYKISVSDQEDGDSKFEEINPKEVLLEVRYSGAGKALPARARPGLDAIMTSNCINCHNFNTKAMGPSFLDMNRRYAGARASSDSLIKRIKMGSTGIWGKEKMPAHPELPAAEIKSIVQWIIKNAADPNVNYFTGTEGYFRIKPLQGGGSCLLIASYTDHGSKDKTAKRLTGQDAVAIHVK